MGNEATATVSLDASKYEAGALRVVKANERMTSSAVYTEARVRAVLAQTDEAHSKSFLKSEKKVAHQAGFLTQQLLQVRSTADLTAAAIQAIGFSTKIGFGATVGLVAGLEGFHIIKEQIDATKESDEQLKRALDRPISKQSHLSGEALGAEIEATQKARDVALKNATTFTTALINRYTHLDTEGAIDKAFEPILEADEKLNVLATARGTAELKIAQAKELSLHVSEREGKLAEIALKFESERAKIQLEPRDAGTSNRLKALEIEERLAKEQVSKQAFQGQSALITATHLANSRGTAEERVRESLDAQLVSARQLYAQSRTILEREQARLAIAKAQQAIYDNNKDLARQQAVLADTVLESRVIRGASRASINATPEDQQRIELQAQVATTAILARQAARRAQEEHQSAASMQAFTVASAAAEVAQNNLLRYEKQRAYQHSLILQAARATTQELFLSATGNSRAASLFGTVARARLQIRQQIHEGHPDLASETATQARIGVVGQLADRIGQTPGERQAEDEARRKRESDFASAEAQIRDARDRRARGAYNQTGDAADAMRAIDDINSAAEDAKNAETEEDPSVAVLNEIKGLLQNLQGAVGTA